MNTEVTHANRQRTARLAGALYLSLVPFGIFSFVYVPSVLPLRGDAAAVAQSILASEGLFRAGVVSHLVSQVLVVLLVLTLYRLFRSVHRERALLMLVLALLCVPVSFVSEVYSLAALAAFDGVAGAGSTPGLGMLLLEMHRSGVLVAQVFWGLWMLPLGALIYRCGFLPRWLAFTVLLAGCGYLVDSGTHLLAPGQPTISQFTAMAELVLPLWLLVKGVAGKTA